MNEPLPIQVHQHPTKSIVVMTLVRSTDTMYVLQDSNGKEFQFQKETGTLAESSEQTNTHTLTLCGLFQLPE